METKPETKIKVRYHNDLTNELRSEKSDRVFIGLEKMFMADFETLKDLGFIKQIPGSITNSNSYLMAIITIIEHQDTLNVMLVDAVRGKDSESDEEEPEIHARFPIKKDSPFVKHYKKGGKIIKLSF